MNTSTLEYTTHPLHEFTLDNGLKVVVREDHRTPQVALTLTFASRGDERPEEFGTGNVLLRALRYLNNDYEAFITESGGTRFRYGDSPGSGQLTDSLLVPAEHLESALKLQSKLMTTDLPDESLHNALNITRDRNKKESFFLSPIAYSPEIECLVYAGSRHYRSHQAVSANLERLSPDRIRNLRRSRHCPDNAQLAITGDIGIEEARRLVERHFADIPRGEPSFRSAVQVPAAPGYRRITQYLDTQHPEYSMMIFIFNTPLVYELEVLGALLEGVTLPRLAALQEKRGGVVPRFIGDNQGNTILGLAFYIHGDPQEAEENFWKFLDEVKRSPFSPEEIDSAVNKACSLPQVWNSSLEHQADALSYLYGSGQPLQLLDDKVGLLRSITPEDVHVAANAYLTRENVTVVCALPIGTKPK
mgnify:FL=1